MGSIKGRLVSEQPKFKIYESYDSVDSQKWRWNVTSNGRIIGASSEGYSNKSDCLQNAKDLRDLFNTEKI